MELSLLKLFCQTVEACPIYFVEDPFPLKALLQALSPLEELFRSRMFVLNEKKFDITPSGKVLYPFAKEMIKNVEEAQQAISSNERGTLILFVGACTGSGNSFLVSALGEYKKIYPEHNLILRLDTSSAVMEKVRNGVLQLGISGYKFGGTDLNYEEILKDELLIIVPSDHKYANRKTIKLSELLEEPFIMEQEGSGSRETLLEALAMNGVQISDLSVAMEVGLHESVKSAVIAGLGVSILPWLSVEKDVESRKLSILRLEEGPLPRKFYLITRKDSDLSEAAQSFSRFLLSRF